MTRGNRLARTALALLLLAVAGLPAAATEPRAVPPGEREGPREPRFIFRFKVPTTRQTAGNVAAAQPAEHDAQKLSEAEMATRQASVAEYLGEVNRSGRALDRAAFLEIYKRAGTFHVIHALLETGVISRATSDELGKLRADLHNQVLDEMARSGKFGRRIGINDFGSGAMNAKSDIDFTLYCDDPNVPGTALVEAYKRIFRDLSGGIEPGRFDLVAHRWEATIPDWRASCAEADFVQKLRTGTQLLKANPEAYFLEGAYAQQILRRSAEGRTFTWIETMSDGRLERRKVNAAADTRFFYRPDTRVRYAWGAAVGNWHFFNSHAHDRIAQAKYLLRSFDDGVSLTAEGGRTADFADLTPTQKAALVAGIYRGDPEKAGRYLAILETAVQIRQRKATDRQAYAPLIEFEKRRAGGTLDDETAFRMAQDALVRHGGAMLIDNNRIAARGRLQDWVAPDIKRGTYQTFDDFGFTQKIKVDDALVKRLQLSAFFEIRDGIERMDRSQVEAIKRDNPRMKRDIEILQRLIEKQRQMALAPDVLDADAARDRRKSLVEEVISEYRALPAVKEVGGVQALLTRAASAWDLGNTIEERLQQRTIDAVAFNLAGRNPEVLVALEKLRKEVSRTNDQLVSPKWMQRMDRMNSLVEVAKAYIREGELNEKVLHAIFWEGVSFLPFGGTYMTIQGGSQGIVTLVSTKLIPGYGPLLITLQLTKGIVEVGMMAIFEPLQRERLLLAYQGYLAPTGGGWITLSSGQRHEVRSHVPSILDGIAEAATEDPDTRREAVYKHFHALVSEAMRRDPSFPFTEEELPWEFAEREQAWVAARIKQHVNHWWDATGPFAGADEILAFRSRLAGEDEEDFRGELVERLFKDYYTGKTRALQKKFLENEKEQAALGERMAEAETMDAGLDAVAAGMSSDFQANGDAILGWCLDEMPTVPPSMEILAAPRVVDLEVEGEREKVRAVPQVGFRAKVWASEKEFPGPWTVRWELRRGGETVAFDPNQDHPPLEAKVGEAIGTDSSRVEVVATATDATGRQIVSASVGLEVEKVKVGEDRPEERGTETARDGTGAGTGTGAGVAGLVEEMERTAGAATAAANEASEACREAAAAGRSAREKATGLTGEVDGLAGSLGGLEGRASTVKGLGTAATAALARANSLANDLAVRRDRAAALREKACAGADRIAAASTPAERERLVAETGSASSELDRLEGEAGNLLASLRREVETARRGSEELDALLAELARLDERLRAAGEAAGGLPAMVEEAEGRLEKARAALDKVATQQANGVKLVDDAKRSAAAAGGGPEAAAAVKKATDLAAAMRTRGNAVAPCADAAAASDVTPAATAARDVAARAGELTSRLEGVRRTVGEGGLRERLRGNAAEAASLLELCETFVESIRNRAADARACLARARSAVAGPAQVTVPDLRGKSRALAEAWLGDLGLRPVVTPGGGAPTPGEADKVASQAYPGGSRLPAGSFVGVTVWGPHVAASPAAPPAFPVPPVPVSPPALTQADCARDWPGTVLTRDASTGTASCQCPSGSAWSKVSRACLSLPAGVAGGVGGTVAGGDCRHMPGTMRDSRTGECRCAIGTWDASLGRCVDTAAAAREKDVAAKRAAADCENLFSRIKVFRGSPDAVSQNAAAEAEREARSKGCDAGRIAEAKEPSAAQPVGGGTGQQTPPVAGGGGGRRPATCQVTEQPGAGGITLVYEQTALGNHTNVYVLSVPTKELAGVKAHFNGLAGFRLVGEFGSYSQGLSAAQKVCSQRTAARGEAEPEEGLCNCVDAKGRRYTEAFGQPCGTTGEAIRDYNCPSR